MSLLDPVLRLRPKRTIRAVVHTLTSDREAIRDLPRWFASRARSESPLDAAIPWMCYSVVRWLSEQIGPEARMFEYGSGGSTLYWAPRVRELVSLEHDRGWHGRVADALRERSINNCDYRLVEALPGPQPYRDYVSVIDEFPDEQFDVVVVDGRSRCDCIEHARPKLKPGGLLVLDNSDRSKYATAVDALADLPHRSFRGIVPGTVLLAQTTVWTVPGGSGAP